MNDCILDIAVASELISGNYNGFDRTVMSAAERRFAEKLIEECVEVCEEIARDAHHQKSSSFLTADGKQLYNGVWGGAMNCSNAIKARFGMLK